MKTTIAFTRNFIRGTFNGMGLTDSIAFVSREAAAKWIRGIRANSRAGKLDYSISGIIAA